MDIRIKIAISFFALILILIAGYLFIQILPIIGLFVAIFGFIILIVGMNNRDDENCAWGVVIMLAGLFIVWIGTVLNASIQELGIVEYLKTFFGK